MPVLPFVCPPDDQYGRSMVVRGLGRALLRLCLSVTAEIAHGDGGGISSGHVGQVFSLFSFFQRGDLFLLAITCVWRFVTLVCVSSLL